MPLWAILRTYNQGKRNYGVHLRRFRPALSSDSRPSFLTEPPVWPRFVWGGVSKLNWPFHLACTPYLPTSKTYTWSHHTFWVLVVSEGFSALLPIETYKNEPESPEKKSDQTTAYKYKGWIGQFLEELAHKARLMDQRWEKARLGAVLCHLFSIAHLSKSKACGRCARPIFQFPLPLFLLA